MYHLIICIDLVDVLCADRKTGIIGQLIELCTASCMSRSSAAIKTCTNGINLRQESKTLAFH